MKKLRKYLPIILLLLFVAAVILIAIGVSRRGPVAPTAPSSRPSAAACLLSFDIAALTCNGVCSEDAQCGTGMICHKTTSTDTSGFCRNPSCLTAPDCLCPTPVPGQPACENKVAYRDVSENTAGNYSLVPANLLSSTASVNPGDKIVFSMTGVPVNATTSAKVVWQDVLDPKLTFLDGDACVTYDAATRTVTCDRGIIGPGQSYNFAVRVQVNSSATGNSISNIAQLTSGVASGSGTISNSCSTTLTLATPTPTPTPTPPPQGGFYIRKYHDHNGNGQQNTGDEGMTWSFEWTKDNGATWNAYQTDGAKLGEGGVVYLPVGTKVQIKEKAVDGWIATSPSTVDLTIRVDNNQLMVFGNWRGTSPTPTGTPAPRCNSLCSTNSDCPSSMNCVNGACRNPSCAESSNCVCTVVQATPTPTPEELPKSGAITDTLKLVGAGLGAVILGIIALLVL